jgi:hypothetical protein
MNAGVGARGSSTHLSVHVWVEPVPERRQQRPRALFHEGLLLRGVRDGRGGGAPSVGLQEGGGLGAIALQLWQQAGEGVA